MHNQVVQPVPQLDMQGSSLGLYISKTIDKGSDSVAITSNFDYNYKLAIELGNEYDQLAAIVRWGLSAGRRPKYIT